MGGVVFFYCIVSVILKPFYKQLIKYVCVCVCVCVWGGGGGGIPPGDPTWLYLFTTEAGECFMKS